MHMHTYLHALSVYLSVYLSTSILYHILSAIYHMYTTIHHFLGLLDSTSWFRGPRQEGNHSLQDPYVLMHYILHTIDYISMYIHTLMYL